MKKYYQNRLMWTVLALVLAVASASLHAKPFACSLTQGKEQSRLNKKVNDLRASDRFYRQLVEWNGEPSRCKGSVSGDPLLEEFRLEFSWPDGSKYESRFDQPEISAIRYTRTDGLARPQEVIARARTSAAEFGLHIDWNAPESTKEENLEVSEYRDPEPGINGIVRLTYDRQHRLVGVSVSMAP